MVGISCASNILVLTIMKSHIKTKGWAAGILAVVRCISAALLFCGWVMWSIIGRTLLTSEVLVPLPVGCYLSLGRDDAVLTAENFTIYMNGVPIIFEEERALVADFVVPMAGLLLSVFVVFTVWCTCCNPCRHGFLTEPKSLAIIPPYIKYLAAVAVKVGPPVAANLGCVIPLCANLFYYRVQPPNHSDSALGGENPEYFLSDNSQSEWSFGQILPMILLALVLVGLLQEFTNGKLP